MRPSDYIEEINEWQETKDLYTTEELLNWIGTYGRQIDILHNIIKERCKKEGYAIDIIKN